MIEFDGTDILARFRAGRLSPRVYSEGVLERAEAALDLNALGPLDPALPERAETAFKADKHAPLAGLPLVVKDNVAAKGFPTSAGTPALADHRPDLDAPCVAALHGAVVAGKAHMHELAFGITSNNAWTGPVRNPADTTRIAGGSSGGTAAAIAAGLVPMGLGTDTGDSCRIPAALCGIVGFRPSTGRYDGRDIVPISHTKDTPGPMARSVRDIILLDSLMAGTSGALPSLDLSQITFGVPRDHFFDRIDPEVSDAIEAAIALSGAQGARIVSVDLSECGALNERCGGPIALTEIMQDLPRYLRGSRPDISMDDVLAQIASPDVRAILHSQMRSPIPSKVYAQATQDILPRMRASYRAAFEVHDIDALLLPTTPLTARKIGEDETVRLAGEAVPTFEAYIRNTDPASNIGAPSISLPLPLDGLPVGLMIEALPGKDAHLLAIASALEELLNCQA